MKKIVVFLLLILAACQSDKNKPNPFIEQDKMENILYDVSVLYGIQSTNSFGRDSVKQFDMNGILSKYGVDSLTFAENNRYYVELKKGVYYDMQKRIIQRLETVKTEIDSLVGKDEEKDLKLEKVEITDSVLEAVPIKESEKVMEKETKKKKPDLKDGQRNQLLRQRVLKLKEAKEKKELLEEKPDETQIQSQ
ncbi:DUF4296 domain-containing protein [Myroides indicus]|uniref:Uncharacterized protein DUF4296 n=1 Tax=Myroides indicus TaxID=1323422 RepID=A0A4R7F1A2_9FLAO|nr:DUF4296 domain-containing protein [Myroides indicus]TDS56954.1 uncharacterized protein DUF4296 [Myroides indicus]